MFDYKFQFLRVNKFPKVAIPQSVKYILPICREKQFLRVASKVLTSGWAKGGYAVPPPCHWAGDVDF